MKRGYALVTALVVLILITMGTVAILKSVGSHNTMKAINVQELKGQYLAEAGMQRALWYCRTHGGICSNETITTEAMPIKITVNGTAASYKIKVCVDPGIASTNASAVVCTIP